MHRPLILLTAAVGTIAVFSTPSFSRSGARDTGFFIFEDSSDRRRTQCLFCTDRCNAVKIAAAVAAVALVALAALLARPALRVTTLLVAAVASALSIAALATATTSLDCASSMPTTYLWGFWVYLAVALLVVGYTALAAMALMASPAYSAVPRM